MSLETFGRYQLLKKLAAGGMAQIYLARQVGLEGFEKLLVVKRILPHLAENDDFITMFLDEARIAARLNHPNVVQIFDLGAQDDTFFIAMEFIHGDDVRRVWKHAERQGHPIPVPLMCRIIIDACAGLDYAHKKADQSGRPLGIVHRDISPQNILVSFEGAVKVVDFGIAKAADQSTVTQSGVLKGKYSYMSPEQAAGQSIDSRSDIFALGVVLYELLTNTRLFKRQTDIQTLNAVTACNIDPPSSLNPRIPPELDAIVMKALAKDVRARFQEARQFGAALEEWLLANQLPASSGALAEFMRTVYAERLTREAEEGRVLLETVESEAPAERATPSGEFRRSGSKATGSRRLNRHEATVAGSNSRKEAQEQQRRPTESIAEASLPTQANGGGRTPIIIALVVMSLVAGAALTYAVVKPGGAVDTSPVEKPQEKPVVAVVTPVKFKVWFESTPPGARLMLDGRPAGVTPVEVELDSLSVTVGLMLDGYTPHNEHLELRDGEKVRTFPLQPVKKAVVVRPPPEQPDKQPPPIRESGMVRFFVAGGGEAKIDCPDARFRGETPPSDKRLPVGIWKCTFTGAEGKKQTQNITVERDGLAKVKIEF